MIELIGTATGSKIQLVLDLATELPPARVDANQVEMAILNLVVNARDAMPNGGTLTISAGCTAVEINNEPKLEAGRYLRLSVRDTGIGMDQDTMSRAVEPFFSTKGVGQGTGLGLSMADGLASQSGGALVLTSAPGLGTTIDLFLPVSVEAVPTVVPHILKPTTRAIGRVLLVDDDSLVRECTADMLTDLGYEVIEAKSAEEALSLLDNDLSVVDGIVSDYLMPGLSGAELVQVLRARGFAIPILIVSGYAQPLHIASDQPFLTKPITQDKLATSLAELLGYSAVLPRKSSLVRVQSIETTAPE